MKENKWPVLYNGKLYNEKDCDELYYKVVDDVYNDFGIKLFSLNRYGIDYLKDYLKEFTILDYYYDFSEKDEFILSSLSIGECDIDIISERFIISLGFGSVSRLEMLYRREMIIKEIISKKLEQLGL